jgi:hypothetical protein
MKQNIKRPKQRGVVLKITFIISALLFLAIAIYINCLVGQVIKSRTQANRAVTPIVFDSVSTNSAPAIGMANPASTNCIAQGGNLKIETKPDGGQYGVCYFDDNRQCEEWALLRGNCPVGGRKITGYVTPAAVFCAISGGDYNITKEYPNVPADKEEGLCVLASGQKCDVWKFYDGSCPANN